MPRLAYSRVYRTHRIGARKLLIETYQETGNFSDTTRRWQGSQRGESAGSRVCCEKS